MPSKMANIGRTNLGQVSGEIRRAFVDTANMRTQGAKDRFTMAVDMKRLQMAQAEEGRAATQFANEQADRAEREKQLNRNVDLESYMKMAGVQDEAWDDILGYAKKSGYVEESDGRYIGKFRDVAQLYKDMTTSAELLEAVSKKQAQGFGRKMAEKVDERNAILEKIPGLDKRRDADKIKKAHEKAAVLEREIQHLSMLESNTRQAATAQMNKLKDQEIAEANAQEARKKRVTERTPVKGSALIGRGVKHYAGGQTIDPDTYYDVEFDDDTQTYGRVHGPMRKTSTAGTGTETKTVFGSVLRAQGITEVGGEPIKPGKYYSAEYDDATKKYTSVHGPSKPAAGEAGRPEKTLRSDIKRLSDIGRAIHKIQTSEDVISMTLGNMSKEFGDSLGDLLSNPDAQQSKDDAIRIFQAEYDTLLGKLPEEEKERFRTERGEMPEGSVRVGWKKGSNKTIPAWRAPDGTLWFGRPIKK